RAFKPRSAKAQGNVNTGEVPPQYEYTGCAQTDSTQAVKEDLQSNPSYFALFSGESFRNTCRDLRSVQITALFSGVVLDLSQADFSQKLTVRANAVFGGIDLITPPGVRVEFGGMNLFGGVEEKGVVGRPYDPGHPVLLVQCNCIFGGVKVL
ncbi:MAG: cell wall-active antibiotics response protein, partial [Oscillospiraceae bacterium]|nr:cell wall-active antibiotics response protein [Oscillospiraceae bacterium]